MRRLGLFAAGCAIATALLGLTLTSNRGQRVPDVFVRGFAGSERLLDVALAKGDGQAYAALARDPALQHPESFEEGAREEAYRAQRPLLPYLAWALSVGRRDLV